MGTFESIGAILSTLAALVIVLLAAWFVLKWMGKATQGQKASRYIAVLDRVAIGQDKWLLVVDIGGNKMAVAMSGGAVTKLCDLDGDLQELAPSTPQTQDFTAVLTAMVAKVRKEKRE